MAEQDPGDKPDPKPASDPGDKPDPDAGAKTALAAERKARREAEQRATEAERRLTAIEDKDKTEVQRLTDEVARLTKDLTTATSSSTRMKVALEKGLTPTQAKRLVGDTEDELAADADELLADFGATKPPAGETGGSKPPAPPGGKPQERLKPGGTEPDLPVEPTDVKALGARMFER